VGLGPTRAFLGCAAGRLTRRHIDIDVGRASPDRSAVSRLGRAGNSAIARPTGSAASAATRVSAASSAATRSRTASTTSSRRAASCRARVGSRACSTGRTGRTASVLGSASRCAAGVGPSGRGACAASSRARTVLGRARGAARSLSSGGLLGSARVTGAIDRVAG